MPAKNRMMKPSPLMSFKAKDGFDLMSGPGIKADIIGRPENKKDPRLIPGTGMGMGLSGHP